MQFGSVFQHYDVLFYRRNMLKVYYVTVIAARKGLRVELLFKIFQRTAEIYRFLFGMHIHVVHYNFYIKDINKVYPAEHA